MTSNRHDKAGLFEAAAEIADPQARAAFLEDACCGDRALRQEIEALLRHDGAVGSFLEQPVLALDPDATREYQPVTEGPGTRIGSYTLREQIGEGGFGAVFMAEQTQPVRRKVALKVLKPGMDSRQVVA